MTSRQREFCRHYTKGKSAKEAAEAAGYASVTCERNAARLLKSQQVMKRIERLRKAKGIVTISDLEKTKTELMHTIQNSGDDRLKILATGKLLQMLKMQEHLDADSLVDLEEQEDELETSHAGVNQTGVKTAMQLLDYQGNPIKTEKQVETQESREEKEEEMADLLPSGQIAFDLKLTAQKLMVKTPKAPVTVVFRPTSKPLPYRENQIKP